MSSDALLPELDMGSEVLVVPVHSLRCGDSPRLEGVDESHARLLAESTEDLPPILVQRSTMRVIDGMHRLRAAQIRQRTHIAVKYLDESDEAAAFIRSVTENIAHGLPLTMADRKAAAARIMEAYPEWSDRAVARATGLSGRTVSAIRQNNRNIAHMNRRMGRDGKLRPVDSTAGRRLVGELLMERPAASLREVAAAAGVSRATAHDVRERVRRGEPPITVTQQLARDTARPRTPQTPPGTDVDVAAVFNDLRRDPAIRYTETGRTLLRWLCLCPSGKQVEGLVSALPSHCLPLVARLTRRYVDSLKALADLADERARGEAV